VRPQRPLVAPLRSVSAALAGYVVIAAATSAGFAPLGGIVHVSASPTAHLLATAVAVLSGLLGGAVAAWIGGRAPVAHAAGTAACVAIESAFLLSSPRRLDPLWFDLLGAGTLIAATIAGGLLWSRLRLRHRGVPAAG
jgi:hypothetical protein